MWICLHRSNVCGYVFVGVMLVNMSTYYLFIVFIIHFLLYNVLC